MTTAAPTFYGRPLTESELEVYGVLSAMEHGETILEKGILITRASYGPWFYVTNRSEYRCEVGSKLEAAVYVDDLHEIYAGKI